MYIFVILCVCFSCCLYVHIYICKYWTVHIIHYNLSDAFQFLFINDILWIFRWLNIVKNNNSALKCYFFKIICTPVKNKTPHCHIVSTSYHVLTHYLILPCFIHFFISISPPHYHSITISLSLSLSLSLSHYMFKIDEKDILPYILLYNIMLIFVFYP